MMTTWSISFMKKYGLVFAHLHLSHLQLFLAYFLYAKAALLVAFYYAFKANNPQRIWSDFSRNCAVTKNTCYPEVTRASNTLSLIFKTSFTKIKSSEIERSIEFDCPIFFMCEFNFARLLNSIKHNLSIEFEWIRLKYSLIGFDWLCRAQSQPSDHEWVA